MGDQKSAAAAAGKQRRTALRLVAYVLLALLVLVGALYAALPALVRYGASLAIDRPGLQVLEVETGYPGLHEMPIHRLVVAGEGFHFVSRGGTLSYDLSALPSGRLRELVLPAAELTVQPAAPPEASAQGGPDPSGLALSPQGLQTWTVWVPLAAMRIEALTLRAPDAGFVGLGALTYGPDGLELTLDGREPEPASRFELEAALSSAGLLNIRLHERGGAGPPLLQVASTLETSALNMDMHLRLTGYLLELVSEMTGLPPGAGDLRASLAGALPWPLPAETLWQAVSLDGSFSAEWQSAAGDLTVERIDGALDLGDGKLSADLQGRLSARLGALSLSARLPEAYNLTFDGARLQAGPGVVVSVVSPEVEAEVNVARLSVVPGAEPQLQISGAFSAQADNSQAEGQLEADLRQTASDSYRGRVGFAGTVAAEGVELPGTLDAQVTLNSDALTAQGSGSAGPLGDFEFAASHRLGSAAGSATVDGAADVRGQLMASVVKGWRAPYDMDAGRIGYGLDFSWQDRADPEVRVSLSLSGVDGHYEDYTLEDFNGEFALRRAGDRWIFEETPVTIGRIDAGVIAREVSAFVGSTGGAIEVRNASAALLGGGVTAAPFAYYPATGYALVELRLVELSLTEVLALEGEEIAGTGRLNGVIPLRVLDNAISVEAGRVKAAPPGGTIRLSETLSVPTGQPGLDFALRALRNFDYSLLEADVNYRENGDLGLAVRLQGRNPDVEAGRPIHYNLNISENIPVLLKSLRLQDAVTRRVERRVNN